MSLCLLALFSLVVGFLCGCTSVGGILLIPALTALTSLDVHSAMATALFSLFFPAVIGTGLYIRHRVLSLRLALPLCLGSLPFSYLGAVAKQHMGSELLTLILALLIIVTGLNALLPRGEKHLNLAAASLGARNVGLFLLGGSVGFLAGLTGAGGPVISVPAMIILGFSPLASVAVAQPFQMMATASGSMGNLFLGAVDLPMAGLIALFQCIGVMAGIRVAHLLNTERLKMTVAVTCIGTGLYLLIREALAIMFV